MRRLLPLLALVALPTLAACGPDHAPPPTLPSVGLLAPDPDPLLHEAQDVPPELKPEPTVDPRQRALRDSWPGSAPRGSVPQVALRFMKALQRGDDLAAERELGSTDRMSLSFGDLGTLHRVMSDVRKNSGLPGAGPCSHARRISVEAAVVTCGRRHVVVNAAAPFGLSGVHLSDWTAHYDVYRGPHTHAYTQLDY